MFHELTYRTYIYTPLRFPTYTIWKDDGLDVVSLSLGFSSMLFLYECECQNVLFINRKLRHNPLDSSNDSGERCWPTIQHRNLIQKNRHLRAGTARAVSSDQTRGVCDRQSCALDILTGTRALTFERASLVEKSESTDKLDELAQTI